MPGMMDGKVAVVTGAGGGIGREIAIMMAKAGAKVIVADNGSSIAGDGAEPDVARETAKALGSNAIAFSESVASPGIARQLVEIAVKQFGGIDIVVNNAGISIVKPALDMLWEIQKTGDIFFPKRWLDVTFSGYQTKDAADIIRAFVTSLPANYPERLKNITLQSADELYRAAEIVKR